ncbi:MAG: DNA primase [Pseudomonadota bacterium]
MVSKRFIHDLLDRVKIEEVVGGYVTLRRSGNSMKGLCPFHHETAPSFHVTPSKGLFFCFGCRKGGTVIDFLQEIEGKGFIEIIKDLAEKQGIPIPDDDMGGVSDKKQKEQYERRRRHIELLKAATNLCESSLWKSTDGEKCRGYLARRDISEETARAFRLGYAPPGGIGVQALTRRLNVSLQDAMDVGLLRGGRDGGHYELFRGRLVFPVVVPGGNVVGFSARGLPGTEEEKIKYINSPETPYYHKGEILFGLPQALGAIRGSGTAVMVEGNFDLLAMVQAGFKNVVAPLGSALTAKQVDLLGRMNTAIVLLFDGDEAGLKAAYRAFEIIIPTGVAVSIALCPSGEDPASFLSSHGKDEMEKIVSGSRDMVQFVIEQWVKKAGDSDVTRVKALKDAWSLLRQSPDELVRSEILRKLPQAFNISERKVKDYLGFRESGRRSGAAAAVAPAGPEPAAPGNIKKEYKQILGAVIDFPKIAPEIFGKGADIIESFSVRKILHDVAICVEESQGEKLQIPYLDITRSIEDEAIKFWFMQRLVGREAPEFPDLGEAGMGARDSLAKLEKENIEQEIITKNEMASEALARGESGEYEKILGEQQKLRRKAKKILF